MDNYLKELFIDEVKGALNRGNGNNSSNSCLPEVSVADNDKIMMVENGKWSAVSIASAEEGEF